MKNLLLIIVVILLTNSYGLAQQEDVKIKNLKSGKYVVAENVSSLAGVWKSSDDKIEINIKANRKHIKTGQNDGLNFYTDVLVVSFHKVIGRGQNFSKIFEKISIELIGIEGNSFYGSYRDPVTKNDVSVTLNPKNQNIELLSRIYTLTSIGKVKDGISFPYQLIFKKR